MAGNLTAQVRNIADVTTAVANGDLSKKITVDVKGEILELKNTINTMVDQLSSFAAEVTRVAREVGTEGKLGGQADVRGVAGTWKDLTDSVNFMAGNLTGQVRNIADVTTAVANGDLSKKITVDVKGEILELKNTINTMVDQLSSFASEVTRVAREVGTEGKLGGQADVKGVAGTWKDLTDSVNFMAGNLTGQVRNIADVTTAVANGDLSKKITVDVKGEILELKNTINTMVDQLSSFAAEVTRVAREVGTEGKLGGQADVKGVAGTWKDLTDSVNFMAGNLTGQVRNIADVTTAVANGDLSKKITVDVKGEILELKNTINTMVDQLRSFASEVTRVAREVGTEGKLGGQADVKGVAGTWKDLTDSVNFMAGNLTGQVRNIADVTTAVANGDLSKKITVDVKGEILELKNTINTMVDQLRSFAAEVTRVAREVGTEGKLGGQADVRGVAGTWKDLTDSVNFMAGNLTGQVRNIADVTKAVANGDLSKKITVDVKGEILELKNTINTMVDQFSSFAAEVTRVAREVGTEGKLGGQAKVKGVSGTWKDLTDNVNFMAGNLTSQVRGIAKVVTAVANGDLKQKLTVEAKGEIAALADTINSMIDTLATFADQVTTVAREVGVEGKLGGQAKVPGAAGTWKDLTENVNQLAANLTTQVRAIAEVATAVTKGDLTRSIKVEAQGEVAVLKDNINEMIRNLKDTTLKNTEQDWLKTNLAKFSRMLQGQKDLLTVGRLILSELAPVVAAQHAVFYILDASDDPPSLTLLASYAYKGQEAVGSQLGLGEGLVGQCALEKQKILLTNVPPDYIRISSGLGDAAPQNIIVLPVVFEGQVKGVLELASFERLQPDAPGVPRSADREHRHRAQHDRSQHAHRGPAQAVAIAGPASCRAGRRSCRRPTRSCRKRPGLLAHQNQEVERKNQEVEQARQALEEKAKQLALTSKYKSEFLANMSHELRTPLNSLLILSDQLSKNPEGNLTPKQTEFAKTIHSSGNDLLMLINDILDLSKIESGTVVVDVGELRLADLHSYVERTFRHVAESKGVDFVIELDPNLPKSMLTDAKRLQQVIKNLLSNAFKFTQHGQVTLTVEPAHEGWSIGQRELNRAASVLAFSVSDTGIGIPPDKQQIIFEAFQQADGSTSRKYGGTGLGLAISREISRLLGGEIRLVSSPGRGSTFTLYLPQVYVPQKPRVSRGRTASLRRPAPPAGKTSAAAEPRRDRRKTPKLVNEVGDDRDSIQPGDRVLLDRRERPGVRPVPAGGGPRKRLQGAGHVARRRRPGDDARVQARRHHPGHLPAGHRRLARPGPAQERHDHAAHPRLRHFDRGGARARPEAGGAGRRLPSRSRPKETLERTAGRRDANVVAAGERLAGGRRRRRPARTDRPACSAAAPFAWSRPSPARRRSSSMRGRPFDCVVLHSGLPDMTAAGAGRGDRPRPGPAGLPLILYSDRPPSADEEAALKALSQALNIRQAGSPERLLDQTAFFLHCGLSKLPEPKRRILEDSHQTDKVLAGKKVLIVDDDIRNIFALTSVLEWHNMKIISAETGREAIRVLQNEPDIDIVLMDIMMPEMDGLDTMRGHPQTPAFQDAADHRRDRQGHEGRPREVHRGRRLGLSCPSRWTPSRCCRCFAAGCTDRHDGRRLTKGLGRFRPRVLSPGGAAVNSQGCQPLEGETDPIIHVFSPGGAAVSRLRGPVAECPARRGLQVSPPPGAYAPGYSPPPLRGLTVQRYGGRVEDR